MSRKDIPLLKQNAATNARRYHYLIAQEMTRLHRVIKGETTWKTFALR